MADLLPLGTALLLGLVHSIDVDHAVAVSTMVSGRPALPVAIGYGVRWGLGHSIAVLIAGIVVLGFGFRIDPRFDQWAEVMVGVVLIGLGLLSLRTLGNLHLHRPPSHGDHAHLHSHRPVAGHDHPHQRSSDPRHHPRRPLIVGLLHGLAGSSGALAIVPITLMSDWWVGVAYLVVFCIGVTGGMVLFALGLAEAIRRATTRSLVWGRRIGRGIALASVLIGGWWIARAV